jgi:hypothetical protein
MTQFARLWNAGPSPESLATSEIEYDLSHPRPLPTREANPAPVPSSCGPQRPGLVHHAGGLTAANADEHSLVHPIQFGDARLNMGLGAERVPAGVDIFAPS